jgi:hypothetical protein
MNFGMNGIQSSSIGMTSFSSDLRAFSASAPAQSSPVTLGDGIDLPQQAQLDFDQIIMSKGGGKQSTTVTCPEGTTPTATQDGQSMTVTCEKNVKKKGDATNKPSQAPIIE